MRGLEAKEQIDVLQRGVVEVAASVLGQRDPAPGRDIDGLRERRRILHPERSVGFGADRKPERQAVDERSRQRTAKAVACADEGNREGVQGTLTLVTQQLRRFEITALEP